MSTRAARGGQRPTAQASSGAAGSSRKAQPPKPDPAAIVAELSPVLEAYGMSEADIHSLVKRCNYDGNQIQDAVAHLLEEREGHEHDEWATTATSSDKKQQAEMKKVRQAQREKEAFEAEEAEKQRRAKLAEDEKKRYRDMAARQQATKEAKKNAPGSALVQRSAPWNPAGAATDASKAEEDAAKGYQAEAVQEDYPAQEEAADDIPNSLEEAYEAEAAEAQSPEPAMQLPPPSGQPQYAPPVNGYPMSAPPGVPVPDQAASWGAQQAGWGAAAGSSQATPAQAEWSPPWQGDNSAAYGTNTAMPEAPPTQQPVNGTSGMPPSSPPSAPSVVPIMNDTVIMPQSFWDLIGNGPIPQVSFGSVHLQGTAAEQGDGEDVQDATGDDQAQQDDGRASRREPRAQYGERRGGGEKGSGGKRGRGKSAKGEAGGDAAGDDGKGRRPQKGSAQGGKSADRGGPGGSGGKGKGWRGEKGDREKGDRQKGGKTSPSQ